MRFNSCRVKHPPNRCDNWEAVDNRWSHGLDERRREMDYKTEGWVHGTALSWAVFFAIVNMNK